MPKITTKAPLTSSPPGQASLTSAQAHQPPLHPQAQLQPRLLCHATTQLIHKIPVLPLLMVQDGASAVIPRRRTLLSPPASHVPGRRCHQLLRSTALLVLQHRPLQTTAPAQICKLQAITGGKAGTLGYVCNCNVGPTPSPTAVNGVETCPTT